MKRSIGVFILGAAFALTLAASASNPQQIDWLGIVEELKKMKMICTEGYQKLISIAVRDNREVGADVERNLNRSLGHATGDLDYLITGARGEMLIPLETWSWLHVAQAEISNGWDDISEEREKLSASAQEELEASFADMLEKANFSVQDIMHLICFDNPDDGCICDLVKSNFNINRKRRSQLRKTLA